MAKVKKEYPWYHRDKHQTTADDVSLWIETGNDQWPYAREKKRKIKRGKKK